MVRELRWVVSIQDMIANASGFEVNRHMFHLTRVGSNKPIEPSGYDAWESTQPETLQVIREAKANAGSESA